MDSILEDVLKLYLKSVHAKRTLISTAMAGFEALFLFGYKPPWDISPSVYKPS